MRTLSEAQVRSQRIDNFEKSTNFADLLQAQASALRVRAQPGDADKAVELVGRARPIYDEALGEGNTASLRCDVQIAWLRGRQPGAGAESEQRFLVAADAYERALPADHLGRAEINWMRAELGGRADATGPLRSEADGHKKAARDAWRAALGSELVSPLSVLH